MIPNYIIKQQIDYMPICLLFETIFMALVVFFNIHNLSQHWGMWLPDMLYFP